MFVLSKYLNGLLVPAPSSFFTLINKFYRLTYYKFCVRQQHKCLLNFYGYGVNKNGAQSENDARCHRKVLYVPLRFEITYFSLFITDRWSCANLE